MSRGLWKSTCYIFNKTALSVPAGPCVTSPHQLSPAEIPTPSLSFLPTVSINSFWAVFKLEAPIGGTAGKAFVYICTANLATFEDLVLNYQQRCSLHSRMFLESCFGKLHVGRVCVVTILSSHTLQIGALEAKGPHLTCHLATPQAPG